MVPCGHGGNDGAIDAATQKHPNGSIGYHVVFYGGFYTLVQGIIGSSSVQQCRSVIRLVPGLCKLLKTIQLYVHVMALGQAVHVFECGVGLGHVAIGQKADAPVFVFGPAGPYLMKAAYF